MITTVNSKQLYRAPREDGTVFISDRFLDSGAGKGAISWINEHEDLVIASPVLLAFTSCGQKWQSLLASTVDTMKLLQPGPWKLHCEVTQDPARGPV